MTFGANVKRAWPVLAAYAVFSAWGVLCLGVSVALVSRGGLGGGGLGVAAGILLATALGHAAGNALGLARLRLAVVVVLFAILVVAASFAIVLGPIALFLWIAFVAAISGYLGIASRLDVVAAWFPLSLAVGAAVGWMNAHHAVATFSSGDKYAVWGPFTLVCLAGSIFLMLVFLATRQSLALTAWQEIGGRVASEGRITARPGRGSLLVLLFFTIIVVGATAVASPYLFRTVESNNGDPHGSGKPEKSGKRGEPKDDRGSGGSQETANGESSPTGATGPESGGDGAGTTPSPSKGSGKGAGGSGTSGSDKGEATSTENGKATSGGSEKGNGKATSRGSEKGNGKGTSGGNGAGQGEASGDPSGENKEKGPDADRAERASREALELGMNLMFWFLVTAVLLFLLGLIGFPPLRRVTLLRHLERPLWPVAPTSRVANLWQRALVTLADAGIAPTAGETPRDLAQRADAELHATLGCGADGLREAAAIVEKLDYAGRGLGAGEEIAMRAAVMTFVRTVDPHVSFANKVRSLWGRAPEVDA